MKIRLSPVQSRESAEQQVERQRQRINDENSLWNKLARGEFGAHRVDEGKRMLAQEQARLRQLVDIANHAPKEPTIQIEAYNAYDVKETLKANKYSWDGVGKCWRKTVKVTELLAELEKIGGTVSEEELNVSGATRVLASRGGTDD